MLYRTLAKWDDPAKTPALIFFAQLLEEMLFEAFSWDITTARPTFASFREHADFVQVFDGWGRAGDRAIVATTHDGRRLGAAWFPFLQPGSFPQP